MFYIYPMYYSHTTVPNRKSKRSNLNLIGDRFIYRYIFIVVMAEKDQAMISVSENTRDMLKIVCGLKQMSYDSLIKKKFNKDFEQVKRITLMAASTEEDEDE